MELVDDKLWPLLVVRRTGTPLPWELERQLEEISARLARRERYVCVVDARRSDALTPAQRQRYVEWFKEHEAPLRQYCVGCAFVVSSAAVRTSLHVILALWPPVFPHTTVATLEAGLEWAADRLRDGGLALHAFRVRGAHGLPPPPRA